MKKVNLWMRIFVMLMVAASQWARNVSSGINPVRAESQPIGGGMRIYLPLVVNRNTDAIISAVAPQGKLDIGQAFNLDIIVDTLPQTRSAGFAISFTTRSLHCEKIIVGPFYSAWAKANGATLQVQPLGSIDNTKGLVSETDLTLIGGGGSSNASLPGPNGIGVALTYVFRVVGSGPTSVTLTTAFLNDTDIQTPHPLTSLLRDAQFNVGVYSLGTTLIDATVRPAIRFNPAPAGNHGPLQNGINLARGTLDIQSNAAYQVDVYDTLGSSQDQTIMIQADGFTWVPDSGGNLVYGTVEGQPQNDSGQKFSLTYLRKVVAEEATSTPQAAFRQVLLFNTYLAQ